MAKLPTWAAELAEQYFGGTLIEFIVYGNINDKVEASDGKGGRSYLSLRKYLGKKLFPDRDAVIFWDPSTGVSFRDEDTHRDFQKVLQGLDSAQGTNYARTGVPRETSRALYLIDKYMRAKVDPRGGGKPKSVALVVDYADLILPATDPSHMSLAQQSTLVTLLRWAKDPLFLNANLTIVLVAENLAQLNKTLVESPYIGRVEIKLPTQRERLNYLEDRFAEYPKLDELCQIDTEQFAKLTGGLSRVNLNHVTSQARANEFEITSAYVSRMKRELIEKECFGMLEFLSSPHGLDTVCGHEPQKRWLRNDARLIREGRTDALPMGYLICGPVGTGKSFMAQCFTHEIGIPCVRLKNFRSQWYGATEANWQKILSVLKAAGPVGVVIDEADAAVGDRSSGHEVSNRVFSMLATEMGDTRNRGHILWFLLTSRPDLLPVDIKRQGRAEIHIPLFYPDSADERRKMREVLIKKCGLVVSDDALDVDLALVGAQGEDCEGEEEGGECPGEGEEHSHEHEHAHGHLPPEAEHLTPDDPRQVLAYMSEAGLSGAEIESILIRSKRRAFLEGRDEIGREDLLGEAQAYIPNLAKTEIELQILVAILECSDRRFLPERLARLDRGKVRSRMLAILRAMASNTDIRTHG
ncbi:MAG TPA: AAA family ATPase [Planctomycetes bacterium]|nr:AAA family ATPase [Planctomycetota bacterium]